MSGRDRGTRLRWILCIAFVLVAAWLAMRGHLTSERLKGVVEVLPTSVFIAIYAFLPLGGFPISVLLLASGVKFGFTGSFILTCFAMAFHTFVAWQVAHSYLRGPLQRWLKRKGYALPTIPDEHQVWFTSLLVAVPGLPYVVELYGFALTNLPLRRYAPIIWGFHVLTAIPIIGFGAAVAESNAKWLLAFGALVVAAFALAQWLRRRYQLDRSTEP